MKSDPLETLETFESHRAEKKWKVGPFSLVRFFMLRQKGKTEGTICTKLNEKFRTVQQKTTKNQIS